MTFFIYVGAALAEIAGCFTFWAWLRLGKSALWLAPGMISLALFAYLLTLAPSEAAGRVYAAFGGVYIAASLLWLWVAESQRPDRWDATGALICLLEQIPQKLKTFATRICSKLLIWCGSYSVRTSRDFNLVLPQHFPR